MKLTLGRKLGLAFGSLLVLLAMSSGLAYSRARAIRSLENQMMEVDFPSSKLGADLQRDLNQTQSQGRKTILASTDPSKKPGMMSTFDANWKAVGTDVVGLDARAPLWTRRDNVQLWARLKEDLPKLRETQETAMRVAADSKPESMIKAGDEFTAKATVINEAVKASLGQLADSFTQQIQQDRAAMIALNASMAWTILISMVLGMAIGISVATFMSRRISAATSAILTKAEAIAAGDLTTQEVATNSSDELGEMASAMNAMQASLVKTIYAVTLNAQRVASASEEFSAVSQHISSNSEETTAQARVVSQATDQVNRNLQTVATGAEEMSATIQDIAKNATASARVAGDAVKTAQNTNDSISKLEASSAEIGDVIKVITSIAQQTNLLALNATIEAARAGEAGKGFAVVANEVKELAKQAAKAAEDISQRIAAIQSDARSAVEAISATSGIIHQIDDISSTIASAVEEQSAATDQISRSVSEAAKGSSEIAQNIAGVAQAAQGTSSSAHESMKAAEQLAQMSTELRGLVEQFRVGTDGTSNSHGRLRAA